MPGLDTDALGTFLREELAADPDAGPTPASDPVVEGQGGGYSNETAFVTWGDRDLVVRRPPGDETADTAHDVLREYRILDALQDTGVPVAPTVAACDDDSVLGVPFYVMERLAGDVLRREEPDRFRTPEHRQRLGEAFVDSLAEIHAVDFEAVDLGDLGRPDGYLERQVRRFQESCLWALETTADEREVPELHEAGSWLAANVPEESTHALVHGDYKLDNVMFAPGTPPAVTAVFDWEMSTLGDPLADLGYALHFWPDPRESEADRVVDERFAPRFLAHVDYPTRDEFVRRYEERTGLSFANRRFYLALAAFKMAALGEMFFARYLRGGVDDPMYREMGEGVPAQAERTLEIIEGEWTIGE